MADASLRTGSQGMTWLQRLGLFHYMALAPAEQPEAVTLVLTAGVAIVLCAIATKVFARRDLHTS